MKTGIGDFMRRNIVTLVVSVLCVVSIAYAGLTAEFFFKEIIARLGRNLVLVLSLLPPVLCGMGLNFSIVLGAAAGQIGLIMITHWGIGGMGGMLVCMMIASAISVVFGIVTGLIFNRTVGQEMITGMIIGYFAKGMFDLLFLVLIGGVIPMVNPKLVLSTGVGLKNTIDLNPNVKSVFDKVIRVSVTRCLLIAAAVGLVLFVVMVLVAKKKKGLGTKEAVKAARTPLIVGVVCAAALGVFQLVPALREAANNAMVPLFTALLILLVCLLNTWIDKTKLGQDIRTCGNDMQVAASAGIRVGRTRIIATVISTVIASWGQIIYLQNMGLVNTYTSHEQVGTYAVAALLVGGASIKKATIKQVFLGAFLFHTLFFTVPQAGINLFNDPQIGEYFRVFISYGVIAVSLALYAWNEAAKRRRALEKVSNQPVEPTNAS